MVQDAFEMGTFGLSGRNNGFGCFVCLGSKGSTVAGYILSLVASGSQYKP